MNVHELSRKFYEETKVKATTQKLKVGEKYILEKCTSHLIQPTQTLVDMKKEGYEIKMTKKDGKMDHWYLFKNYDLKDMARHIPVEALIINIKGSGLWLELFSLQLCKEKR